MGERDFNRGQCIRALLKLGFYLSNKRSGKHDKYKAPMSCNPPFIMMPRHKDIHCQSAIITELFKIGGKKMVDDFISYL
jgi:predicted RNA binding protein YcfA (HicA-like mRNA interferase family)